MPTSRAIKTQLATPLIALIGGLVVAALVAWHQAENNAALARERFESQATQVADRLIERLQTYEYGLRGARGVFIVAGESLATRRAYRAYAASRDIDREYPGARGFGFIRRVPVERERAFVAAARRDDWPQFAIRQLTPHDNERYVIQYIEPVERNRQAVGLDIASETNRRNAAVEAMRTGRATLTAPITLVQATGLEQRSFLLLLPVYRVGAPLTTEREREAATWGWTYSPLIIDEVLQSFDNGAEEFSLAIEDATFFGVPERFYVRGPLDAAGGSNLSTRFAREIFGRKWIIEVRARPAFVSALNLRSPLSAFATLSVAALLSAALLYAYLTIRTRRLEALAQQARLARFIANSSDAIIAQSLDGVVTSWNAAAERIFGYRANEAIGKSLPNLICPADGATEGADISRRVAAGEEIAPFETVRRRRDGSQVDVSIAAWPITAADGRVVGIGKTLRDVSARKLAERQLQEFNAKLEQQVSERTAQLEHARRDLRMILDSLPSMIGYWDRNLINRFANRAYHDWFGVQANELPGKHIRELLGERLFELNLPYMEAALRGEPQTFERLIRKPGTDIQRHALAHYLPDIVDGDVRGFYALVHDVSELTENRRRLAAALRENEALLTTLHSYALVSIADGQGTILEVNDAFCAVSGYSRDELIGKDHRVLNSGTHDRAFWAQMWGAIGNGAPWRGEICNRAKNGSLFWVDSIIAPFRGEDGKIEKYVTIRNDVTARKSAARELARERERLTNIIESTNVGTWELNLQTGVARFNERWARIGGYTLAELAPTGIETGLRLAHPDDVPGARALLQRHMSGDVDYYEFESRVRHRNGSWVWVLDRGRVMTRTPDGKAEWMFGTRQDINEARAADESLRRAKLAAEAANAAKSEFVANISHEIRTPLNAVIGLAYLLQETAVDDEQRDSLAKIQTASRSLLGIINDVLDLSKIEAGEMGIERAHFDLYALLDEVGGLLGQQAREKGLTLEVPRCPPGIPQRLIGDVTRIRQILINLLNNAIKFTRQGSVRLLLECAGHADGRIRLRWTVRDTGIGIAPESLDKIFAPFSQADSSTTRRFGGTGLGLSIVRKLTELMGGTFGVRSELDVGSEFWVELPLTVAEAPFNPLATGATRAVLPPIAKQNAAASAANRIPQRPDRKTASPPNQPLAGLRILAVDDSEINLEVASKVLERAGAAVRMAGTAADALAILAERVDAFDLVLMDVQMPDMDGHAAARKIRDELNLTGLPIVALSAGTLLNERQRALDAGMNEFIAKPLDPQHLIRTVRRLASANAGEDGVDTAIANAESRMRPPPDWPHIEGLDATAAALRFNGDIPLYVAMLEAFARECDEFAAGPLDSSDERQLRRLAAQLHKLRGTAGTLGAIDMQHLAREAEAQIRNAPAGAHAALKQFSDALCDLTRRIRAALRARPQPAPNNEHAAPVSPEQLKELEGLLRTQDLAAVERFRALSAALRARLGIERFDRLRAAVDGLRFADAAAALSELRRVA